MRPVVTDQVAWSVGVSVGVSVTIVSPAKKLLNLESRCHLGCGLRLAQGSDGSAHWRHLANTTEPSMSGGDVALCQMTMTTCYYYPKII